MGCHGGLSVSDVSVGGLRQAGLGPDAHRDQGAVFAGNTGYGYGDDTVVGATEDLMRRFATGLDGTLTPARRLAQAKQQYVAGDEVVTPFDEKVVVAGRRLRPAAVPGRRRRPSPRRRTAAGQPRSAHRARRRAGRRHGGTIGEAWT